MKVLYTAGPIRDKRGLWYAHRNIERAGIIARTLWSYGAAVICPQLNTAYMDGDGVDDFLPGDFEIILRCDGVVLLPGWKESKGALSEFELATIEGIPFFDWTYEQEKLKHFIES